MKKVARSELLDWVTYSERRDAISAAAQHAKALRRIHVGEYLTFLFENAETMRYQVQEMMRVERMVKEEDIRHELDTYNELLGDAGQLGCTLLVEIEDPAERDPLLVAWIDLPERVYVKVDGGAKVYASIDERQRGRGRLSTVQYLKFDVQGRAPVAVGCDHPAIAVETVLTADQRAALRADLSS